VCKFVRGVKVVGGEGDFVGLKEILLFDRLR